MRKEWLITILNREDELAKKRKRVIERKKRSRYEARRLQNTVIILYDLAQINTGTTESPVWSDPPILKSPSYSAGGVSTFFDYTIEDFDESDYQAFTDSLFTLGPVTEWKNIFRRLVLNPAQLTPPYYEEFPNKISFESPVDNDLKIVMFEDRVPPLNKQDLLNDVGLAWTIKGLEYRNLEFLHWSGASSYADAGNNGLDWFPFNDDDATSYKVTETYDPDATDVMSDLTYSGRIELYLIPMPCLYFAVGALAADYNVTDGFNVMFAYQVLPRQNYPEYADPFELLSNDARTSNFLGYQKTRAGMVASHWHRISPGVYSETSIDPTSFMTGLDSYKGQVTNNIDTTFYQSASIDTRSKQTAQRFLRVEDYLIAVMKLHGRFYYIWAKELDEFGNMASLLADNTNRYEVVSDSYPDL